ncbi:hypothetical protein BDZ89DRAFT_1079154, partial [Hymenopellis radicata]
FLGFFRLDSVHCPAEVHLHLQALQTPLSDHFGDTWPSRNFTLAKIALDPALSLSNPRSRPVFRPFFPRIELSLPKIASFELSTPPKSREP